MKDNSNLQH